MVAISRILAGRRRRRDQTAGSEIREPAGRRRFRAGRLGVLLAVAGNDPVDVAVEAQAAQGGDTASAAAGACPVVRDALAATTLVVIYAGGEQVIGCYKPTGRSQVLGDSPTTLATAAAGDYAVVAAQAGSYNPAVATAFNGCAAYLCGDHRAGVLYVLDHGGNRIVDRGAGNRRWLDSLRRPTAGLASRSRTRHIPGTLTTGQ